MNIFDRADARLMFEVCKEYEKYIDFLFKQVEDEMYVIQEVETKELSNCFSGNVSERFKAYSIEQIKSVFDFNRINVLYNLLKQKSSATTLVLDKLNNIHIRKSIETNAIGLKIPLNANNLLINMRVVKSKREELEYLIDVDEEKRNKK